MRTGRFGRIGTLAALMAGTMAVSGCESFGNPFDVFSGKRQSPDEFQVLARKPLRMPGSLSLPEPRLGEPSPLEPDPEAAAVIALLGAPAVSAGTATSPGEQELLSAANAAATDPAITAEIEAAEERIDRDQPYEPPSIFEVFDGVDEQEGAEDALNPAAEARRLQSQGVSIAPIDPDDRPIDEEGRPSDPEFLDRRPVNRLPSAPTTTAF